MSDVFDKCSAWKDYRIAKATGLYPYFRPIEASHGGTEVEIEGRRVIMVGSNNYLGLAGDPRVKEAAIKAVEKFGTTCSGSRLLNGTLALHEELEARLAKFLNREAALVVSTGFQTNLPPCRPSSAATTSSSATGRTTPRWWTASASPSASEKRFRHNDMEHLEQLLAGSRPRRRQAHRHRRRVLDGGRPLQPAADRRSWRRSTTPG